jgi:16S rRNA (cytidine1402-2'-O)-methyltransferase
MSNLYIIATPIGNLEDITLRALRILKEVDFVLSEDTRVTGKLLKHFEIDVKTFSFHEHSNPEVYEKIAEQLQEGKNIALVTDAGTPGISDPGSRLINFLQEKFDIENFSENDFVNIIPIPGASSLVTAISVSGINGSEFYFAGFAPKKKGRQTFFKNLQQKCTDDNAVIFFESGHRIEKTLNEILEYYPESKVVLSKELTKIHENIVSGTPQKVLDFIKEKDRTKGEFVVIVQ